MSKRFTAIVIGVNLLIISLMFFSGVSVLHIGNPPSRLIINQFDLFRIESSYYSLPGEPAIDGNWYSIYWPTYLFIIAVALNVVFIAKVLLAKENTNKASG
jgi:hypothetical protein